MTIKTWAAVLSAALLSATGASLSLSSAQAEPGQKKLVHSFSPTPLFRGVAGASGPGVMAQADMYVNSRTFGGSDGTAASFEIAVDFAVLDETGNMIADHCVARTFSMRTPLDLKKIRMQVVENGIRILFPDGEHYTAELFTRGDAVEVVILALAVRGDGKNLAGVEKTSLLIEADLDGDGKAESVYTKDGDWQEGIFTS
jgi:hypothetical protein